MCGCRKCGIWFYGDSDYGHGGFANKEDCKASMEQAASKWNTRAGGEIAATLGGGKLTAEQVRELIAPYLHARPTFDFGRHGAVWMADWQAIADELNATIGGGECEDEGGIGANGEQVFSCSECGCVLSLYDSDGMNTLCTRFVCDYPRFCPSCGKTVKQ